MDTTSSVAEGGRSGLPTETFNECALFCLPYAGGDSMAFWRWQRAFPASVRVRTVDLPGRDGRVGDPARISSREIAAAIAARAPVPYALYGHSMGARLAFEVCRELVRLGAPGPLRLYVGAAHPPHLPEPLARIAHLSEDGFVEQLILRAGTPVALREDPDVRAALLPAIRSDLQWLQQYRYRPAAPLPMPVVAFAGMDDREVSAAAMLGWARHTSAPFRLHTIPGDHLFIHTADDAVAGLIANDVSAALSTTSVGPAAVPLPAPDEIHVWLALLDRLPGASSAAGELSSGEAARAAAFHREVDRRRYTGRCVVLRRLLRRYGIDLGREEVPTGRHGKPHLGHHDLRFSVSHSDGTMLAAFGCGDDIGVDVERLRPMANFDAFCDGALTADEQAEVVAAPEELQLPMGLRFWTAKEAVLKATGDGLGVEPNRFGFAGQRRDGTWRADPQPDLGRLSRWLVTHLDLDGAVAAVATRRDRWRLRFETVTGDLT